MSMTPEQARDAILGVFLAAWSPRVVVYTSVPADVPTTQIVWARPAVKTMTGRQSALTGGLGQNQYTNFGLVWVQVFAPIGDGGLAAIQSAKVILDAYRDARLGVWFRNVRQNEMGQDGAFERVDVKADFEYYEVR